MRPPGGYEGAFWVRAALCQLPPPTHADSFGICLVPQASEDKFDCYKCHWREGSMCGYGICE